MTESKKPAGKLGVIFWVGTVVGWIALYNEGLFGQVVLGVGFATLAVVGLAIMVAESIKPESK